MPEPDLFSRTLWSLVGIFVLGAVSRVLLTDEKIDWRRGTGEILLALMGAGITYFFGLMQGLSTAEVLFYGSFASLGTLRLLQLIIKVVQTVSGKLD